MKFISICSGIEAASVAFNTIGWKAVAFSEIEPFPCALLAYHYPDIPNFGDMTKFREWPEGVFAQADMIVGGPPCQSFSVAGKREGLNDDRGNLTLIYTELIDHADTIRLKHGKPPVIILYENVPGILSDKTNAFGSFLGALAGESDALNPSGKKWTNAGAVLGPQRAIAWRILDAQYFGVAQRRRRVFVVASARDGFDPAKVLFEFEGVRRDIAPSREQGQKTTGDAGEGACKSDGWPAEIASTLNASFGSKLGLENQHIDGGAPLFVPAKAYGVPGNWIGRKPENGGNSTHFMHEIAPNQTATDRHGVVAFAQNTRDEVRFIGGGGQVAGALSANPGMKQTTYLAFNSRQDPASGEIAGALDTCSPQAQAIAIQGSMIGRKPENGPQGSGYDDTGVCFTQTAVDRHAVATQAAVRRLTPTECERLQGFPDGYSAIPWRNKPAEDCPDGHRYKALGNSWAVPNVRWIGERIQKELFK